MLPQRFWAKVVKGGGCWEWSAAKNSGGYGRFCWDGRNQLAHRLSWAERNGDPGELCVLHRCDNPSCVNPDHLFLGTRADNAADREAKGRHDRSYLLRYSDGTVYAARALRSMGMKAKEIAMRIGVPAPMVSAYHNKRIRADLSAGG